MINNSLSVSTNICIRKKSHKNVRKFDFFFDRNVCPSKKSKCLLF